jgi:hypothetical protein
MCERFIKKDLFQGAGRFAINKLKTNILKVFKFEELKEAIEFVNKNNQGKVLLSSICYRGYTYIQVIRKTCIFTLSHNLLNSHSFRYKYLISWIIIDLKTFFFYEPSSIRVKDRLSPFSHKTPNYYALY